MQKPEKIQYFLATYGEWLYRLAVMLGFVAILWLNQHYVTKEDFSTEIKSLKSDLQQINSRIDTLVTGVNAANTAIAVTQQRQSEIEDLKQRVRDLERDARVKDLHPK